LKIAVASTRKPKTQAVLSAARTISGLGLPGWAAIELIARDVDSGVSSTPTSDEEMMTGARNRVQRLVTILTEEGIGADLYIGLEGGLHVHNVKSQRIVLLRGWAYATDGNGVDECFGASPALQVPAGIAGAVLDHGLDLADVIDRFSGRQDVRSNDGTWGILTAGLITRLRSFEIAALAALAPFYNRAAYV